MYFDTKEKAGISIDSNKEAIFILALGALINLFLFAALKPALLLINNIF
jgi:hypothetical protein